MFFDHEFEYFVFPLENLSYLAYNTLEYIPYPNMMISFDKLRQLLSYFLSERRLENRQQQVQHKITASFITSALLSVMILMLAEIC
jgi:hypothetical protein